MYSVTVKGKNLVELKKNLAVIFVALDTGEDKNEKTKLKVNDVGRVEKVTNVEPVEELEPTKNVASSEEVEITEKEVIKKFQEFAKKQSAEKAIGILQKLGVKRVTELKKSQYSEALKLLAKVA